MVPLTEAITVDPVGTMGVATDTGVGVAVITTTTATVEGEEDTGGEGDTRRVGEAIEPTKIGVTVIEMAAVVVNVQGDWFSVSGTAGSSGGF